jgi:integrase
VLGRTSRVAKRRFHDLRHSCATLLLVQNVAHRVVMEILGHSQISPAMNTYSHGLPGLKREAASQMDKLLTGGWERDDQRSGRPKTTAAKTAARP